MAVRVRSRDQHFEDPGPKRILCLDGGGVRGVMTLGVLARIEDILRERHGGEKEFRLCHYFDLIAGTSTGAIIAAALAKGLGVRDVQKLYRKLAKKVFKGSFFRQGVLRAKYDADALTSELQTVLGKTTKLGSTDLRTGLLVVMKRSDTGSPWPVSNNPKGKYYDPQKPRVIPNRDYPLWAVVRASTAAPSYFEPELLRIADGPNGTIVTGTFVDGGVSTANNPSLLAFRFATLDGYRLGWRAGEKNLLIVSVGTGAQNPDVIPSVIPGKAAVQSLLSLMQDCNDEVETLMQWMGRTHTARVIDSEIGNLEADTLGVEKLFSYERYNVELSTRGLNGHLELGLEASELEAVQEMDSPENVELLDRIGNKLARHVQESHFPPEFDLDEEGGES